jgi:hypothetical protein
MNEIKGNKKYTFDDKNNEQTPNFAQNFKRGIRLESIQSLTTFCLVGRSLYIPAKSATTRAGYSKSSTWYIWKYLNQLAGITSH